MTALETPFSRPVPAGHRAADLAALFGGILVGNGEVVIENASDIQGARTGDIVFAEAAKFFQAALRSQAAAIITTPEIASSVSAEPSESAVSKPLLLADNPRAAFVSVLEFLASPWLIPVGIHPTAVLEEAVRVGQDARIGPHVSIESGVQIGADVVIMAGARIGQDCEIGEGTVLYPNVVLYPRVKIGKRCLLHAGCVLGADGFGFAQVGASLKKVPHLGIVEVGDEVEIGVNTCIDRAKTGKTVIGSGTKLDNLAHIAHNVQIGQSCLIIAQVGVAGSVKIGNGVIMAGQSGIADHLEIGDGARIAARAGVIGNVAAGETVSGYPARPHARKMREHAAISALPDYVKRIRALEKRLAELEQQQAVGIRH